MKITLMKMCPLFAIPTILLLAPVHAGSTNPITKVVAMLSKLQQDVIREGEEEQKVYNKFAEMCSDRSRQLHQEIKTAKASIAELSAKIEKADADMVVTQEKLGDCGDQTSSIESDLQKASAVRKKEASNFKAIEQESQTAIGALQRATIVFERNGPKASLVQIEHMQSVTQVLQAMVEASTVDASNAATLTALLQSYRTVSDRSSADSEEDELEGSATDEEETDAPAASVYKGQSKGIVETLQSLLDKAQVQLEDARTAEASSVNSYQMLQQSLEAKLKTVKKQMAESTKALGELKEVKATAKGNLQATTKELNEDEKQLKGLHHECLDKATSFEEATSSRNAELKALAEGKRIILEATGGAAKQKYGMLQTSFLQVRAPSEDTSSVALETLHSVRGLALDMHSISLVALTNQMAKAIKGGTATGMDPFGKVRRLVEGMISKLETEAGAEATKKARCDKELAKSTTSKETKEDTIAKLTIKVHGMAVTSKKLKGEVKELQKELAALAKTQAEMHGLRAAEKANYEKNKPQMEQGLEGVKTALKILRDYYSPARPQKSSSGAAQGIVGMLEVIEVDFSKSLAEMTASEEVAAAEYEAVSKENKIARAQKEQDVKYLTAQHLSLDSAIAESKGDISGVGEELAAVKQYYSVLQQECIAKPDAYEDRKARREKEMAGLNSALEMLSGNVALLQVSARHKTLRGAVRLEPLA